MSELINWYFQTSHTNWITLCSNILYYCMWFAVLNRTHCPRFGRAATLTVEFIFNLLILNIAMCLMPFMSGLRMFLGYAAFFLVCFVLFRDPKLKISLTLCLLMILNVLNEMLGAATYFPAAALAGTLELMSNTELILQFYGPYLTICGLSCLLLYIFLNHNSLSLSVWDCALLVLFPMSQFILMVGWLKLLVVDRSFAASLFFAAAMFICLLADIALFIVIRSVAHRAQLESENRQFAQLMDEQVKHYEALTTQYEDIRRMRHDIAKHMDTVDSLLSRGEHDQARIYVSEMKGESRESTVQFCRHPVADAFLHSRLKAAEEKGIKTDFMGDIRADVDISSTDLIRCLGNLLDNAYEGCQAAGSNAITLRCAESGEHLVIITENRNAATSTVRQQRIPGLERGVGTRVLSDIAAKYAGSFASEETDGIYRARLVLKARKEEP